MIDYEVVKKKARLAMGGNMNTIERSAFWFRYERNSLREEPIKTPTPEPEFVRRQWDIVKQLRADNVNLRTKWYEHLKEDKEYRAKKNEERIYKYK